MQIRIVRTLSVEAAHVQARDRPLQSAPMTLLKLCSLPPLPCLRKLLPLLALAALLAGCGQSDHLSEIKAAGVLKVVTRNGPTTYYEDRHGPTGFEYQLAELFAKRLGVRLEIQTESSLDALLDTVERGRVDLAAAGLTMTPDRLERVLFTPPYLDVEMLVLVRDDHPPALSTADLAGLRLQVLAHSSHAEALRDLRQSHPTLQWIESEDVETTDLLDALDEGTIDATIVDSNEYIANRAFYPRLRVAFRIGQPAQLAWAVSQRESSGALLKELETFFTELRGDGRLAQMIERHYSHTEANSLIDSTAFNERSTTVLPRYLDHIQNTADEFGLDWRLLAAISYQESHWNPRAVSFTGVRGFMMLTLPTARAMGVRDREDAQQSLRGGARYFVRTHQKIPGRISEPDRTWFALAAYNVGLGHLEDARKLALRLGKDPDKWADVKEVLPLLSRQQWYSKTRHGYARGSEPVRFVQNVRHYYNLLTWSDIARQRTPPATVTEQYLPEGFDLTLNAL